MAGRRGRGHGRGAVPGRGRPRWFASGGRYDKAIPTGRMACALESAAPGGRVPADAADDEVTVMMACWQAIGAHAEARMLAMAREIIRRRPAPARDRDGRFPRPRPTRSACPRSGTSAWRTRSPPSCGCPGKLPSRC
jgi:hypothetical protein